MADWLPFVNDQSPRFHSRRWLIPSVIIASIFALFFGLYALHRGSIRTEASRSALAKDQQERAARLSEEEAFKKKLDVLITDATKLDVLTSQGVNHADFSAQLATVQTDRVLMPAEWPSYYDPLLQGGLDLAIEGWNLTNRLWNYQLSKSSFSWAISDEVDNDNLISAIKAYLSESANIYSDDTRTVVSNHRSRVLIMTQASDHFSVAMSHQQKEDGRQK